MPNVMAALRNIGGILCSMPQSLADAQCRAVTLPKCETCSNLLGCPKLPNRSQPLVGRSSPLSRQVEQVLLFNKFFPTVDTCLSCEDIAGQSCAMVPRWPIFGHFCILYFQRSTCTTFQTCILNLH